MSWSSCHSVGGTDASVSTFVRWFLWLQFSKQTVGWTDDPSIGSSSDLGFGNSKGQRSASSAPDDLTLWPVVYPTLAFKSDRDAPKVLLQHRMNRHLKDNSSVHPTPLFGLHSTTPSGCSWTPDGPTDRRCIDLVTWFNGYIGASEWPDDLMPAQGEPSVHPTVLLFRETFPTTSLPC
jgi:hypothetical protein